MIISLWWRAHCKQIFSIAIVMTLNESKMFHTFSCSDILCWWQKDTRCLHVSLYELPWNETGEYNQISIMLSKIIKIYKYSNSNTLRLFSFHDQESCQSVRVHATLPLFKHIYNIHYCCIHASGKEEIQIGKQSKTINKK